MSNHLENPEIGWALATLDRATFKSPDRTLEIGCYALNMSPHPVATAQIRDAIRYDDESDVNHAVRHMVKNGLLIKTGPMPTTRPGTKPQGHTSTPLTSRLIAGINELDARLLEGHTGFPAEVVERRALGLFASWLELMGTQVPHTASSLAENAGWHPLAVRRRALKILAAAEEATRQMATERLSLAKKAIQQQNAQQISGETQIY